MSVVSRRDPRSFTQKLRFERLKAIGQNDTGSPNETWTRLFPAYAAVDGTKASERYVGGEGMRSIGDYTVWIYATLFVRYRPTPKDRIVWESNRGLVLNILDIPDQQLRGQFIAVFANSGLNEG